MKSTSLFMAFVVMLFFVSCSEDNSVERESKKEVKVTGVFKFSSADWNVSTRANDQGWENNDAIGVFMMNSGIELNQSALASNVKYITKGSISFTNPSVTKLYFPFNKQNVDFIAYYPYKETINNFTYSIDVRSQVELNELDLLYSENVKSVNSEINLVELGFKHQLVNVIIDFNLGDLGNSFTELDVKVTNVNRNASFLLSNATISDKNDIGSVSFNIDSENKRAQAILLPEDDLTGKEIIITIDQTPYALPLKGSTTDNQFNQSTKYTYSITLREGKGPVLDGMSATIENWIDNKIDDAYADEVPKSEEDESNNGEEGSGSEDGTTPGENEGENDDLDNPNTGEPTEGGDGTEKSPYTIADVLNLVKGYELTDEKDEIYAKNLWIEGYIVGSYHHTKGFTSEKPVNGSIADVYSLAISDISIVESDIDIFPVELNHDTFNDFNLNSNYSNLGKKVLINADIGNLDLLLFNPVPALVKLKKIKLVDI